MKISLDALQVLDAIDRHGSFTAAAAFLHRVPSALSHAIARLESDLDVALFIREGRRATLTEAGRLLLEDGRHLLQSAQELERRVQRTATGWETELRIAVDTLIPPRRLFPLVERYYQEGHSTRIHLSSEVFGGTWDALTTGRADLVIGAPGDMPARSGITTRPLCSVNLVFAVASQHPLASYPEPIPADELRRHRAAVVADTSRELVARTSGLLAGQDMLRLPDMVSKAAAQVAGLGVGHLPRWLAEPEVAAGRLVIRQLAEPRSTTHCHIAWRPRQMGKALAWFLEALDDPNVLASLGAGL